MAAVSLHPLASRSGQQSSTVVSVQLGETEHSSSHHRLCGEVGVPRCNGRASPSPSTPTLTPATSNGAIPTRDVSSTSVQGSPDRSGDFHPQDRTGHTSHGIMHSDIEQYPVIDDVFLENEGYSCSRWGDDDDDDWYPYGKPPELRAMSASQLDDLYTQYTTLDIPHSTVFPYLHGVDGDNPNQNLFFGAPLSGMPAPNYRGLTIVRADMPSPEQQREAFTHRRRTASSASALSEMTSGTGSRSRTDSLLTTGSSSIHSYGSSTSSDGEDEESAETVATNSRANVAPGNLMQSVSSSSMASSDQSRASSLFSGIMSEVGTEASSVNGDPSCKATAAAGFHARASRHRGHRRSPPIQEPQPPHSFLASTVMPSDILNPPLAAKSETSSLHPVPLSSSLEQDSFIVQGASFVQPEQTQGVSLRNFRIQCAKYATISDIVLYCPAGFHKGVMALAEWFRDAQEACFEERCKRGQAGLRYNVFIITDAFEVFERNFPHLVAVDGSGFSRNCIDFIDREREEMQRVTAACEIDENVWMGSSADVPLQVEQCLATESSSSFSSMPPEEANPLGFDICIEGIDGAEMPEQLRLHHASFFLDSTEAAALQHSRRGSLSSGLEHEDCEITNSGPKCDQHDSIYLGPNGWSPGTRSQSVGPRHSVTPSDSDSGSLDVQKQTPAIFRSSDNIVYFETIGAGAAFATESAMSLAIEDIMRMVTWIKSQASLPKASGASTSPSHSLLHGALRGVGSGRTSNGNTWSPGSSRSPVPHHQRLPRRVLIHCCDGYTESSVLGLAYLMYSRELSLPEAYVDLQNRCNRSFFVYARDVPLLRRLEKRIGQEIKQRHRLSAEAAEMSRSSRIRQNLGWPTGNSCSEDAMAAHNGKRSGAEHGYRSIPRKSYHSRRNSTSSNESSPPVEQSVWARGLAAASGLVGAAQGPYGKKPSNSNLAISSGNLCSNSTSDVTRASTPTPTSRGSPCSPRSRSQPKLDHSWFDDPRFEGSFPSRILPFLYLGNLNHALNPSMLHALGITHVVSVGESALHPPWAEAAAAPSNSNCSRVRPNDMTTFPPPPHVRNSLWHEEREGRISVLDLQNVSDDGIDSLRPHMREALEYIEQARLEGGKVLVHCRVGVSRSATICIAMVMAHCDLSMAESFLLVRSRRLNVLTQPTLLFVWDLRGLESQLATLKRKRAPRRDKTAKNSSTSLDSDMSDRLASDDISLASLSLSNNGKAPAMKRACPKASYSFDDLKVEIGAGAGSVYGFSVPDCAKKPFNSGSLTKMPYASAKLTHGYFCKQLSDLNARYRVG